jgi:hypothetical protein
MSYGGSTVTQTVRRIYRTVSAGVNRAGATTGDGASGITTADMNVDLSSRHLLRAAYGATATTLYADGIVTGPTAVVPGTAALRARFGASTASTPGAFWQGQIAAILITNPLSVAKAAALHSWLMARRNV